MTNESKFETLAISSLPLGKGYRVTINLEHHVDVPLPYVNAHVCDFLSASAAFATKMRDAIDPPPKEESQAPDNAAKVHNNVEPAAWGVANCKGLILDATTVIRVAVEKQSKYAFDTEVVPLYRSPTLTDAEREALHHVVGDVADITGPVEDTIRGLLERTK